MTESAHPVAVALTVAEAAAATGLSSKAIRRRIERGSLPAFLQDGRRRIPLEELVRAGLLRTGAGYAPANGNGNGGGAGAIASPQAEQLADARAVIRELLDRVERQSAELARLRLLAAHAERRREAEIARLRRELALARRAAGHRDAATAC